MDDILNSFLDFNRRLFCDVKKRIKRNINKLRRSFPGYKIVKEKEKVEEKMSRNSSQQ